MKDSSRWAAASGVGWGAGAAACAGGGHPRRQPLVVGLDRDRGDGRELRREGASRLGLGPLGPVERDGNADDDQLGALGGRDSRRLARVGRRDHSQRAHDRRGRVADRRPRPHVSMVDRQNPHRMRKPAY